jgi:DNA repair protein RadA/Sms
MVLLKHKMQFACNECGSISAKWLGQCPDCKAWNTLEAQKEQSYSGDRSLTAVPLSEVDIVDTPRQPSGIAELDRVLGGGFVPGSVILLGGDPGIGKSTLFLQCLAILSKDFPVLYISGEESLTQIAMRAKRLQLTIDQIWVAVETQVGSMLQYAQEKKPKLVVVDSIQTMVSDSVDATAGSVAQLRKGAQQWVQFAKQTDTTVLFIGHVTKDGQLAGPRVLEHMVDTVLYFEGASEGRFRMLRAVKNRFGAVNELGVFAMSADGLKGVSNPSQLFLAGHQKPMPGSTTTILWEGTRPLLIEVQALVDATQNPQPRRLTIGIDPQRLSLLLAILHRHTGIKLGQFDVFINVVGGIKVQEPSADLAILAAIVSSLRNQVLEQTALVGEVGLSGEIRPVAYGQERVQEAFKHGMQRVFIPKSNRIKAQKSWEVIACTSMKDWLSQLTSKLS